MQKRIGSIHNIILLLFGLMLNCLAQPMEERVDDLISKMTLEEKIGQMSQFNTVYGEMPDDFKEKLRKGLVGSVLNEVNPEIINEMQRIAVEESRLGIPLLMGRDVIHGFKTILPIPLGQAATWNPELIEKGARIAAVEARSQGVNWTFAPMIDITRDPRWGRIAESLGEDPYLTSVLGAAMVRGFQGSDLADNSSIAACAKHFVGYGAAEGGRDYNTVTLPENELRDVYLPPFKACVENGVATVMTAFNEINGVPATGDEFLTRQVLRKEWNFDGFVVSDWESVTQQVVHGHSPSRKEAAAKAIRAGVDMEMASTSYAEHIRELLAEGRITQQQIDDAVRAILSIKFRLGLFEDAYTDPSRYPDLVNDKHREIAKQSAVQSLVLLKNDAQLLPLSKETSKIGIIGPLADTPFEQLGTWIFDGDSSYSITPLEAIRADYGISSEILFARGLEISRAKTTEGFEQAVQVAEQSDVVILFLGEEAILSGESHCRADINLPGAQEALVSEIARTGKPVVTVILAGRPLTFRTVLEKSDALIYAWHPGTMAGPAISDILFGKSVPSGKLPVTIPTHVGQIPMYYAHKNTGKPPTPESWTKMDDIPVGAPQLSIGNTSHYIDEGYEPLFPFGYGLSYTSFEYSNLRLSSAEMTNNSEIEISVDVTNSGSYTGDEVVQLYVRDLFADRTRPVRELKAFKRIRIPEGQKRTVHFTLGADDLAFHNRRMEKISEPGGFQIWIGGDSNCELTSEFLLAE